MVGMALWSLVDTNCCTKSKYAKVQKNDDQNCFYFMRVGSVTSFQLPAMHPMTKEMWSSCLLDCN
jgi:hypothetical protein